MKISLAHSKFLWAVSAIFRSPAKSVRKDAWNSQSSLDYSGNLAVTNKTGMKRPWGSSQNPYKLFWKSYGYHHNRYENQPGTFKVLMDNFGNLMVGGTTDMKISLTQTASMYRTSIGG